MVNGRTETTLRAHFALLRRRLELARKLNTHPFGWRQSWRQAGHIQLWSARVVLEERAERAEQAEFERSVLADLAALPTLEAAA